MTLILWFLPWWIGESSIILKDFFSKLDGLGNNRISYLLSYHSFIIFSHLMCFVCDTKWDSLYIILQSYWLKEVVVDMIHIGSTYHYNNRNKNVQTVKIMQFTGAAHLKCSCCSYQIRCKHETCPITIGHANKRDKAAAPSPSP